MNEFLALTKALSDKSRVRALLSVKDGELCLCQIIEVLNLSPSTVSKHMDVLQRSGLVQRRKAGKWHFYKLAGRDEAPLVARRALEWALKELRTDATVRDDARRVREVRQRDLAELSSCYRG